MLILIKQMWFCYKSRVRVYETLHAFDILSEEDGKKNKKSLGKYRPFSSRGTVSNK